MEWTVPEINVEVLYTKMLHDTEAIERIREELMKPTWVMPTLLPPKSVYIVSAKEQAFWLQELQKVRRPVEQELVTEKEAGHYIRQAAQAIEQYGWTTRQLGNTRIGFCVIGAVAHLSTLKTDAIIAYFTKWLEHQGIVVDAISRWNDEPGQDKDTILLYMHKFADEVDPLSPFQED